MWRRRPRPRRRSPSYGRRGISSRDPRSTSREGSSASRTTTQRRTPAPRAATRARTGRCSRHGGPRGPSSPNFNGKPREGCPKDNRFRAGRSSRTTPGAAPLTGWCSGRRRRASISGRSRGTERTARASRWPRRRRDAAATPPRRLESRHGRRYLGARDATKRFFLASPDAPEACSVDRRGNPWACCEDDEAPCPVDVPPSRPARYRQSGL